MRPNTVAEACSRVNGGEAWSKAFAEFLDAFYGADISRRVAMLAEVPPALLDPRYDAVVGGIGEFLFKHWTRVDPPSWISDPRRYLSEPFFPNGEDSAALREYLVYSSPGEFKSRNVMVDETPLRRASMARAVRPLMPRATSAFADLLHQSK